MPGRAGRKRKKKDYQVHFRGHLSSSSKISRALVVVLLIVTAGFGRIADAHRLRPAVVTADFATGGELKLTVATNFEVLLAGIAPKHEDTTDAPEAKKYAALRALSTTDFTARLREFAPTYLQSLRARFDDQLVVFTLADVRVPSDVEPEQARITTLVATATVPTDASAFTWRYPALYGGSALRISVDGAKPVVTEWLPTETTSKAYQIGEPLRARTTMEVAAAYTWLGYIHILPRGLDHILFVLGIFLLSIRLGPVVWQVTAFTVAHSITLGLALFGHVAAPAAIVEPLIALSIVYIGVENILTRDLKSWRVFIVFLFGLLHGMGFAGVLLDLGLPAGETVTALITFNVGVELGQLSVIALALLATFRWRDRPWFRRRVVVPGSLVIAVVGAFWTLERIGLI